MASVCADLGWATAGLDGVVRDAMGAGDTSPTAGGVLSKGITSAKTLACRTVAGQHNPNRLLRSSSDLTACGVNDWG